MNRFLEADYRPKETEVVVRYSVQPLRNDSFHECLHELGAFLGLSGTGKIFDLHQEHFQCKIAFPEENFEPGNLPQNLSLIAGNIFDFPKASSIKIEHIDWSKNLLKTFPGPAKGIKHLRKEINLFERPLSCGILLPRSPLSIKECLEKAYLMWMGGCDMVLENETMTSVKNEIFEERIDFLSQEMKNCENRSKSPKRYIPSISAGTMAEVHHRASYAKRAGINIVSIHTHMGWSGMVSTLQLCQELHLDLMIRQNGIGPLTRSSFGWSTAVLSFLYRILGAEFVAVDAHRPEIDQTISSLTAFEEHVNPSFPVLSGNIHPAEIEGLLKQYGYDLILQVGNGMEQHPDGIKAGAEALQYAIEMATQGIELDSAMKKNEPLRRAVESWTKMTPIV